jgi:triosephosphate isomerase
MKKKSLVIANWKMNPESAEEAKELTSAIKRVTAGMKNVEVVIAPSFPHLPIVGKIIARNRKVSLGAQNVHYKNVGAYTGEVSPLQLRDLGVKYVIVGHSERRAAGETNELINLKVRNSLANGLSPVLCIGEKERDRDGNYLEEVKNQLAECLRSISKKDLMDVTIAYEPVWAIGKSFREGMTGTDMHEMALFIKKSLASVLGGDYDWNVKILYGGSVEPENAEDLIKKGEIAGFLVGHDSLDRDKFKQILKIVDGSKIK